MVTVSTRKDDFPAGLLSAARDLVFGAFDDGFTEDDWAHTAGGVRVIALDGGVPVGHAAVVPRVLHVAGRPVRTGYVEGVATAVASQGQGIGSLVMQAVGDVIRADHEMGALSTGRHTFYERLGWERWLGPTFVRDAVDLVGERRTPDEDDGVMVLRHGPSAGIELTAAISCEARSGDDW